MTSGGGGKKRHIVTSEEGLKTLYYDSRKGKKLNIMTSGGEQKNIQGGRAKKFARLQRALAALPVKKLAACMDY